MANARTTTDDDFHCSFCGKRRREVRKLVSGPRVFICNECVVLCREIIGPRSSPPEAPSDDSGRTTLDMPAQDLGTAALPDDDDVTAERKAPDERHCSFCGKAKNDVARLVNGPTVYICNECVDLCEDIIAVDAPAP